MSTCATCRRKCSPWSKDLISEGYNGCDLLMNHTLSDNELIDNIKADTIGKGWVTDGHIATNYQLLIHGVRSCNYYIEKNLDY